MFENASSFDQDISLWNVSEVVSADFMFEGASLSTANYDALLIAWGAQSVQTSVAIDFGNSLYTSGGAAEAGRNSLISQGWTISDGGPVV